MWAYDCEYSCEASLFGKEFLRMTGIATMLHRHCAPCDVPVITIRMPTEREHSRHNPELKREEKSVRLQFLKHLDSVRLGYRFSITRFIVLSLAVYGLYSLLS